MRVTNPSWYLKYSIYLQNEGEIDCRNSGGKVQFIQYIRLVIMVVLIYLIKSFSMKPYADYIKTPTTYGCKYDSLTFTTSDGAALVGWYIYSQLQKNNNPAIIFSYGDAGNMSYFLDYAVELSKHGFDVLLYDYRGFGKSSQFEIDKDMLIYREFIIDLHTAIDYVKEKYSPEIILFGLSMGACLSISVAGNRDDISAVVAEGPYENTNKVLGRINFKQQAMNHLRRFKNESSLTAGSEPEDSIKNFGNTAFYAFTGSTDEIVTAKVIYTLYELCPARQKSIWIAAGTEHGNIVQNQTEQYFNNIYGFIDTVVIKPD